MCRSTASRTASSASQASSHRGLTIGEELARAICNRLIRWRTKAGHPAASLWSRYSPGLTSGDGSHGTSGPARPMPGHDSVERVWSGHNKAVSDIRADHLPSHIQRPRSNLQHHNKHRNNSHNTALPTQSQHLALTRTCHSTLFPVIPSSENALPRYPEAIRQRASATHQSNVCDTPRCDAN